MDKKKKRVKGDYDKITVSNKKRKGIFNKLFKRYIIAPSMEGFDINFWKLDYEIKEGKSISVKSKYWKKARRLKASTLGAGYDLEGIKNKISDRLLEEQNKENNISEKAINKETAKKNHKEKVDKKRKTINDRVKAENKNIQKLIDNTGDDLASKGVGYTIWANRFNTKQIAKAYTFLNENNISSKEELKSTLSLLIKEVSEVETKIKDLDKRIEKLTELKTHILNYSKYKDIYNDYKKLDYNPKFYVDNKKEIELCKKAKKYFDTLEKVPKIKDINDEFKEILLDKKNLREKNKTIKSRIKAYENTSEIIGKILKDKSISDIKRDKER